MPTVGFHTLGCKVNQQETSALAARFKAAGFEEVPFDNLAEVYVINSCAVTALAERKSLSISRRKKKHNPQAFVVLAGCFPQVSLDRAGGAGVDLLVGSNDKGRIVELVSLSLSGRKGPLVEVSEWSHDTKFEVISDTYSTGRARATLKVQDGCEQYCAYCIIPYARGPERSLSLAAVLTHARSLLEQGYKEIVLSGIHLGAYGRDLEPQSNLTELIRAVTAVKGILRIRLGSVEPNDITPELIEEFWANKKLCSHVHIPLQSGSDSVLKRMKRRYSKADFLRLVSALRAAVPDIGISSDIIMGFPGETEEEFQETLSFLAEAHFSRLHVFRYSQRVGTLAYDMPAQVPENVKEERVKMVQALAEEGALAFHRFSLGKTVSVLIETEQNGQLVGHTPSYIKVFANGPRELIGEIVEVEINSASSEGIYGKTAGIDTSSAN